jgi:hypothetical protein
MIRPARRTSTRRPEFRAGDFLSLEPLEARLLLTGMPEIDAGVAVASAGLPISVTSGFSTPFVVDWDNDGMKDLLVGQLDNGKIRLYLNAGTDAEPVFNAFTYLQSDSADITTTYGSNWEGSRPVVVDFNNDGLKDLVVGEYAGSIRLYTNVGTDAAPVFSGYSLIQVGGVDYYVPSASCSMPVVVDWNNDGAKDIVVGDENGGVYLLLNTGTDAAPAFTGDVAIPNVSVAWDASPTVVDWNGDGRKDILLGQYDGSVLYFENAGTDASPSFTSGVVLQAGAGLLDVGWCSTPTVADWNSDGTMDLLAGAYDGGVHYYHAYMPAPSVSVTATDPLAWEPGGDTGTFRITRVGLVDAVMTVSFTMSGSGVRGTDYNLTVDGQPLVGDSVDIPALATFVDVVLVAITDATTDPNQQAVLTLHATPDYAVKPPGTASVLIRDNLPTLSLQATDALAAETVPGEAANPGTFWISRTQTDMSQPLVVNFNLTGSTATSGSDYAAIGLSVTIPAGARFASVPITAIDDDLLEGQETVVMTLVTDPSYAISPTAGTAAVTILDNEPSASVTATAAQAAETPPGQKPKPGAFKFLRSGTDKTRSVTVQCDYSWGTATAGVDYAALPEFVTIPAGMTSVTVPVTILDDDLAEPAETVVVRLVSGGASLDSASVTIADNEPVVSVAASTAQAAETLPGQKPKPGAFTVTRTGGDLTQPLLVKYSLDGSTATNGTDFAALSGEVTILANAKSAVIPVTVLDDDEGEPTETVLLTLSADAMYNVSAKQPAATVKIADNEPIISVKASDALAAETLPGAKPNQGAFTVTRTGGDLTQPLLVKYSLAGSTAANGTDFAPLSGEVTILVNAKTAVIPVTVIDDDEAEPTETAVLTLSADAKYNINAKQQTGTVKIADNEPIVSIRASDPRAAEVAPGKPLDLGAFTVTRTGGDLCKDLLVKYTLAGTADSGIDFEALSGEVTILAGAKTAKILVTPKADGVKESPETIALTLLADPTYLIVAKQSAATVTLIDNIA